MGDWQVSPRPGVWLEREYRPTLSAVVYAGGRWAVYYKGGDPYEQGTCATLMEARDAADAVALELF